MSGQSKQPARKRIRIWLLAMSLFMSWSVYTAYTQMVQTFDQRKMLKQMSTKLEQVKNRRSKLELEIEKLEDPEYIGQLARQRHGMFLPGEKPIKIQEN